MTTPLEQPIQDHAVDRAPRTTPSRRTRHTAIADRSHPSDGRAIVAPDGR